MAGPLDSLLTQADSANPAVFASGVSNLQAPKPAPATAVTTPGAVGGYGPAATGVYVPPGGTRALDIQSAQPVDLKTGAATPVMPSGPGGTFANAQERRAWYMQEATARGIPTELVDRLVNSEGGWATFDTSQDSGTSFGPLAMHVAGTVPGTTASGLGDEFRKQTGLNPADPKNEMALARFGLDYIKANGASPDVWHGLRNVPGISLADRAAAVAKVQNDKYAEAAGLNKTADAAIKAIGTMQGDLGKAMERVRAAQGKADQANDAALASISKAPPQPDINGFKQLNGLAVLVGVLGGIFTKSPMRSSINAAAAAIEGYNDHDREAYETSYKNWKTQTDLLFKISDMTQNRVKDILYAENMGFNERNALLDSTLRAAGLTDLANQRKTQGDEILMKWREDYEAARVKQRELEQKEKDAHEWRMATLAMPKNQAQFVAQRIADLDAELAAAGQPPLTATEKLKLSQQYTRAGGGGGLSDDAADLVAQQILSGQANATVGLARSPADMEKVRNRVAALTFKEADELGMSHDKAGQLLAIRAAEFQGLQAGERTAGQQAARLGMANKEAQIMMPIAVEYSHKLDRTQFPNLNAAMQAVEQGTGDTNVTRFVTATNSLLNSYARAVTPVGQPTDKRRDEQAAILNTKMTAEQFDAAIEVMMREMNAALQAPGGVKEELRGTFTGQPSSAAAPVVPPATALPQGIPPGSTSTGRQTKDGRKVWKAPDGQEWAE